MHKHPVQARISTGVVEGFARDGVRRWRSIPYARPPVGTLRFRAPQPPEPWSGVRHCHGFTNCAPQEKSYTLLGPGRFQPTGEDCLTLNVTAPRDTAAGDLPVMVFIHGGGYIMGSSATPIYDGAALARRGCIYVSVNYRLGALGCLDLSSLSTSEVRLDSNLYLRDLVLALRWVRENIAVFGGDPDNVTIFGESAGRTPSPPYWRFPRRRACSPGRSPRAPPPDWCGTPRSPQNSRSGSRRCWGCVPPTPRRPCCGCRRPSCWPPRTV